MKVHVGRADEQIWTQMSAQQSASLSCKITLEHMIIHTCTKSNHISQSMSSINPFKQNREMVVQRWSAVNPLKQEILPTPGGTFIESLLLWSSSHFWPLKIGSKLNPQSEKVSCCSKNQIVYWINNNKSDGIIVFQVKKFRPSGTTLCFQSFLGCLCCCLFTYEYMFF